MRRVAALLVATMACTACWPAEASDVPRDAGDVLRRVADRDYRAVYDASSDELKRKTSADDLAAKLRALEGFGELVDRRPTAPPTITETDGQRFAEVVYAVTFALGDGTFTMRFRANDVRGRWELLGFTFDVSAATYDPPYTPDDDGAEKLARRFLYLWQNRRYDDLKATLDLRQDPEKVRDFLEKLENAGNLLTLSRNRLETTGAPGARLARSEYALTFDNGTGRMSFTLKEIGGEWRVDGVDYGIEYATTGGRSSAPPT
jgi:hypothetical protein